MTQTDLTPDYVASPAGISSLVRQFRTMQVFMVNAVTGDGDFGGLSLSDCVIPSSVDEEYTILYNETFLRIEVLQEQGIQISNPNIFRTLHDWRLRCRKDDLPTYRSRRLFIAELYDPMLRLLEDALAKQRATDSSHEKFVGDLIRRFAPASSGQSLSAPLPPSIGDSLVRFRVDHDPANTAFIMMRFSRSRFHAQITQAIKSTLGDLGIVALRADDAQYHDDLLPNIQTYMHGCGIGIAVLERIERDDFNPNVSLEIGYMLGLGKPVCLLKDKTLHVLPVDLAGKLYREFSMEDIQGSIQQELSAWVKGTELRRGST